MSRWTELVALVRQAVEFGCEFRVEGDVVTRHGDLPEALAQQLDEYRDLWPSYCDVHADSREAITCFERFGVELVHITTPDHVPGALELLEADATANGLPIAIDMETTSKAPPTPRVVRLTKGGAVHGVQPKPEEDGAALNPYTGRVASLQMFAGGQQVFVFTHAALPDLLRDPWLRTHNFVAFNAGFERMWLQAAVKQLRAPPLLPWDKPGRWHCAQQAAGLVIGVGYKGSLRSLHAVVERLLGQKLPKDLQLSDWGLRALTLGQLCYAASDVVVLHRVWTILTEQLTALGRRDAYRLQINCIDPVTRMVLRGVGIDRVEFDRQIESNSTRRVFFIRSRPDSQRRKVMRRCAPGCSVCCRPTIWRTGRRRRPASCGSTTTI
jgi:hypothetical protein